MANKTIPQLPEQTGITDNDLLAIVDSGETTTSKIKLSTLLSGVGGGAFQVGDATDSIVPGYSPTSRGLSGSTTYVDKLNLEGEVFTSNANETFNLVQSNTTVTDNPYNRAFAGHHDSKISSTNSTGANMLIGTLQGVISNGFYNTLIGMGTISGTGQGNGMFATSFTSRITAGNYNVVLGGQGNDCLNGNSNAVVGGIGNEIGGGYSFNGGGNYNTITGTESGIVGGNQNGITGIQSVVAGGNQNDITGNYNFVGGGAANDIQGQISAIIGGNINNIGSSGGFSAIVGGKLNNVNHNYSVVLGGQSQTTLQNEEVVVPKLRTTQYASLNFSGDTAAAAGGVQLGEFYHDNGAVRVRIT